MRVRRRTRDCSHSCNDAGPSLSTHTPLPSIQHPHCIPSCTHYIHFSGTHILPSLHSHSSVRPCTPTPPSVPALSHLRPSLHSHTYCISLSSIRPRIIAPLLADTHNISHTHTHYRHLLTLQCYCRSSHHGLTPHSGVIIAPWINATQWCYCRSSHRGLTPHSGVTCNVSY